MCAERKPVALVSVDSSSLAVEPSPHGSILQPPAATAVLEKKTVPHRTGALVISLDFELYWGVRDCVPLERAERAKLLRARAAVPRLLDLFEEFSVHATWAVVGLLFARSRDEAEAFKPRKKPNYLHPRLNPYREHLGAGEDDDPFHFAPSLIAQISARKGQEIASHSFSHYYCLEEGQNEEDFEADLSSAIAIAMNAGHTLRSYVFPRNQVNPAYLAALKRSGILAYRGNEPVNARKAGPFAAQRRPGRRIVRLLDTYIDLYGPLTVAPPENAEPLSIQASRYLRPYRPGFGHLEPLLVRRITEAMEYAAEHAEVFHLWWHPEDFASHLNRNLQTLRCLLEGFAEFRSRHGMVSLSMADLVEQSQLLSAT
jgi:peptidoglycan/xylan/chitin deacetylase (PgdA/CDA1 family)